ncbi:hypothetical protein BD770DRAFT_406933 [Pilaira anomala]|nr:hypothetical protein BD770DRAFT_406933 [Pilaira anomala]
MRATLAYLLLLSTTAILVKAVEMEPADPGLKAATIIMSEQEEAAPTPVVAQVVVIDKDDVLSIAADMAIAAALAANNESKGAIEDPNNIELATEETVMPVENAAENIMQPVDSISENIEAVDPSTNDDIAAKEEVRFEQQQQEVASTSLHSSGTPSVSLDTVFTFSPITLAPESSKSAQRVMSTQQKPSPRITSSPVVAKIATSEAALILLNVYWKLAFTFLIGLIGQHI